MKKLVLLFLVACTPEDWVVAQENATGDVKRCWHLRGIRPFNNGYNDGLTWHKGKDYSDGTAILPPYRYLRVEDDDWRAARRELGISIDCVEVRR